MYRLVALVLFTSAAAFTAFRGDFERNEDVTFKDVVMAQCRSRGNKGVLEYYEQTLLETKKCIGNIIKNHKKKLRRANGPVKIDELALLCSVKPRVANCYANFTRAIGACTRRSMRGFIKPGLDAFSANICEHRESWLPVVSSSLPSVSRTKTTRCLNPILRKYKNIRIPANRDSVTLQEIEDMCKDFVSLEKCYVEPAKQHEDPPAVKYYEDLFSAIRRVLPCEQYLTDVL